MTKTSLLALAIAILLAGCVGNDSSVSSRVVDIKPSEDNVTTTASMENKGNLDAVHKELVPLFNDIAVSSFMVTRYFEDKYATGSASVEDSSGFWWIAKRVDEKWQFIYRGQENINCQVLKDSNVPPEFYPYECFANSGSQEVPYPDFVKSY